MNWKPYVFAILMLLLANSAIAVWYQSVQPNPLSLRAVALLTNGIRVIQVALCARLLLGKRHRE